MVPLCSAFAGILFFVTTLGCYIKWNDQWFRDHADAETKNKQLHAHILRASWLAEMFFEGKEKDKQIPEQLLDRLSVGLFADTSTKAIEHPSEQMVDLIKKISNIKASKDAVELTKSAVKE